MRLLRNENIKKNRNKTTMQQQSLILAPSNGWQACQKVRKIRRMLHVDESKENGDKYINENHSMRTAAEVQILDNFVYWMGVDTFPR